MIVTIPEKLMIKAYRRMIGTDIGATICLEDFADDMKKPIAQIQILGQQLVEKGLAKLTPDVAHGWTTFTLTTKGWEYVRKQKGVANKPSAKKLHAPKGFEIALSKPFQVTTVLKAKGTNIKATGAAYQTATSLEANQIKTVPIAVTAKKPMKKVASGDKKKQKIIPHLNLRCPACGYYAKTTPEWMSKGRLKCPVDGKDLLTKIERGETRGRRF